MSTVAATRRGQGGAEPRLRTIGSVCEELREEFPDISVSKIRYLEDQASSRRAGPAAATGSSPPRTSSG